MDAKEFREFGRAAVDFIADYLENIRDRLVFFIVFLNHCFFFYLPKKSKTTVF